MKTIRYSLTVCLLVAIYPLIAQTPTWEGGTTGWNPNAPGGADAIINSSDEITTDFTAATVTINSGVSMNIGSSTTATIQDNITNNGLGFSGTGTVFLDENNTGNTISIVSGSNTIAFEGVIRVASGTSFQTNQLLRLTASSASNYGILLGDGLVSDDFFMQAWLDLAGGTNDGRWYYLSGPFGDAQVQEFNTNPPTTIMESENSSQGSVWEWDATNAEWIPAENGDLTGTFNVGLGYAVYAGSNSFGDFIRDDAGTIEVLGEPDMSDRIAPLNYNDGQNASVNFAGGTTVGDTEGWNLMGNPYTAPYDWGLHSLEPGLSSTKYTYATPSEGTLAARYESYNQTTTAGAGNRYIAPFQGFFVQMQDPAGSNNFTFAEANRVADQTIPLKKNASSKKDGITLEVRNSANTVADEVWVGFWENATESFDRLYDGRKLKNYSGVPTFYTSYNGANYSISHVELGDRVSFPIVLEYNTHDEDMKISANTSDLRGYQDVVLVDNLTGITHDLTSTDYHFKHDTTYSTGRFVLKFSGSTIGLEEANMDDSLEAYAFAVENGLKVNILETTNASIKVYDLSGVLKFSSSTETGSLAIPLESKGFYIIKVRSEDGQLKTLKAKY